MDDPWFLPFTFPWDQKVLHHVRRRYTDPRYRTSTCGRRRSRSWTRTDPAAADVVCCPVCVLVHQAAALLARYEPLVARLTRPSGHAAAPRRHSATG